MERQRPISDDSLLNIPRGTRQYWEGQYDALIHCARVLRQFAKTDSTPQQLNKLAAAIEMKAHLTVKKLGDQ